MAEWLGSLMQGWPGYLIVAAMLIAVIGALFYLYAESYILSNKTYWRKKRGKK